MLVSRECPFFDYSELRWTNDLDLWIAIDAANALAVFNALKPTFRTCPVRIFA